MTGGVRDSTYYSLQVIVNGLVVSVVLNGEVKLTRQYDPRFIEGRAYGLNMGLVGVGSDNSRGTYDNFSVQVLPPQTSFEQTDDFADGVADLFTAGSSGSWSVTGGRYVGTPSAGSYATSLMTLPVRATGGAVVTLEATIRLSAGGRGGIVFDQYGERDLKYVQLDLQAGAVVIGHRIRNQWVEDVRFATPLAAGVDYRVALVLNGTAVAVSVNGTQIGTLSYNGAVADGGLGTISGAGTTSYDDLKVTIGARVSNSPDNQPPVLTPPVNLTRSTDPGQPKAFVSDSAIGSPTVTDNVPGVVVTRSGVPAGNLFAIGVTTITWTATDVFGNQTTKTQTVTVTDNQAPSLSAPPNVTRTVPTGTTSLVVTDAELGVPVASDNSGSVTVVRTGVPAGNVFPLGTTTITYTASDPSGNTTVRTQTITISGALRTVTVTATDASGAELLRNPIVFTISTGSPLASTVVVNLAWTGTAAYGTDYTVAVSGGTLGSNGTTLTLAAGSTGATITVTPTDDTATEPSETVVLTVGAGSGYLVGSPASASGSIADNDALPTLSIADVSVTEGNTGTKTVTLTVRLSAASTSTVTVAWATANGTATAGTDYRSATGTLSFSPGVTSRTFTVTIIGDKVKELNETFLAVLSNAVGATLATGQATVTIVDDEKALTAAAAGESSGTAALTADRLADAAAQAEAAWPDADFSAVRYTIGDLDGELLALTSGTDITVDATAAGWGWDAMDLHAVLVHELGHVLGLEHDEGGVMSETLAARQLVHLDLDGADGVTYDGPVHVPSLDVPAFVAPAHLAGQEAAIGAALLAALQARYPNVVFMLAPPPDGTPHSTVYVGGSGEAFAQWGLFFGLSEHVDDGNADRSDVAFVFSDNLPSIARTAEEYGQALATYVGHEVGHLLGFEHAHEIGGGPLDEVAFKPYTHVEIAKDIRIDLLEDGKLTIRGEVDGVEFVNEYEVHPRIVEGIRLYPAFYYAGAVGPDGFPDITYGQRTIHPVDTGTFLARIFDMAWAAQTSPEYTEAERLQILAFAYGYATHATGDFFAHSMVNEFSEGIFPAVFDIVGGVPDGARELANGLRHLMMEDYFNQATPRFDANSERDLLPNGDISDDETPGIVFDAPTRFIYETLLKPFPDDPSARANTGRTFIDVDFFTGRSAGVHAHRRRLLHPGGVRDRDARPHVQLRQSRRTTASTASSS